MFPSSPGPIGVFDSGYGGLTILKEIRETLPEYDYIYLGDNARIPTALALSMWSMSLRVKLSMRFSSAAVILSFSHAIQPRPRRCAPSSRKTFLRGTLPGVCSGL